MPYFYCFVFLLSPGRKDGLLSVMNLLSASDIGKKEGEEWIVKKMSFVQARLQKLALAGATGSGKTTLLKMLAGLTEPTIGTVAFKGEKLKGPNEKLLPGHPAIAYLSQHFELRNHYRVQEILDMAKKVPDNDATLIYDVCRISHLLPRWTHQLSGGERQRIALARLLAGAPELLLLDEPYSNLDPFHKTLLKSVVHDLSEQLCLTCILVSHDPQDALSWADEILVLRKGELIQKATPEQVYANPVNDYAAGLFGKYNVLTPALANALSHHSDVRMSDLERFIRPEEFLLVKEGKGLKTTAEEVLFMGGYAEVRLRLFGADLVIHTGNRKVGKGEDVYVSLQGKGHA